MIILKVTKKQSFTIILEDTIFEKPQKGGWGEGSGSCLPPGVLKLI